MQYLNVSPAHFFEHGLDLQGAASVGGDDDLGFGFQDVGDFATSESVGHIGFGQVV